MMLNILIALIIGAIGGLFIGVLLTSYLLGKDLQK